MRMLTVLSLSALLLASACDNDPAKGKTKVEAKEAVPAPTGAAPSGSVEYAFSAAGSKLEFTGAKVTDKHEGAFKEFTGTVNLVDGDVTKSRVSVEIAMASVSIEPAKLQGHLKSPDFFDVEKFPKASFTSTSIKAGGESGATHTVTGNLTLHGVTKSITFPATIKTTADGLTVNAEFAINRKDFGIVYPGMPDDLIKDDVAIKLTLAAKKNA